MISDLKNVLIIPNMMSVSFEEVFRNVKRKMTAPMALKVKLMLRRPLDQLVAQGIMPYIIIISILARKAPASFHDQRRQLERAKTGDMLKAKIQQRPPRQELERRHILESDPGHLDPSLAEKQRMLKKARLADQLNDQLSHRPGPLELIQKNILHTEEPIEHMVKAGRIPYKATCEGNLNRPQHPSIYVNPEDDSQSSEDNLVSPGPPSDVLETAAKSAGIVVSLIPASEGTVVVTTTAKDNGSELVFAPLIQQRTASSPASLVSSTSTLSPLSSIASPVPSIVSQPATPIPPPLPASSYTPRSIQSPPKSDAPGKDKNRKKSKSKSAPKTRTIKFHEYKGPPSAQKSSANANSPSGESSYDLLLQQQTLLLQFQLQLQHKYPQIILPASQKNQQQQQQQQQQDNNTNSNLNSQQPSPSTSTIESGNSCRLIGRLEDMKVSDLKAELKRRNLPVSGSKPQLIERLKPFTTTAPSSDIDTSVKSPADDSQHDSPMHNDIGSPLMAEENELMDVSSPLSPLPQPVQVQAQIIKAEPHDFSEDIVKKQQRRIEELQRELTLSQMKLEAATRAEPKAQLIALQKHLARQQQQQIVDQIQMQAFKARQAEEQQRLQQQQHVAFQNQKNLGGGILLNTADASIVLNQLMQGNKKILNGHNRTNSLPNFINSLVTPVITAPEIKTEYEEDIKPPPLYEEVIKKEKNNIKSQIVDDVLEILIENGELPPSAANDPATPDTAGNRIVEPVFPQNSQPPPQIDAGSPETALGLDASDFLEDTLENMDINQLVIEWGQQGGDNIQNNNDQIPMDTDDWLECLLPSDQHAQNMHQHHHNAMNIMNHNHLSNHQQDVGPNHSDLGYDPLLAQGPFDPFSLEDFRSPQDIHVSWDYAL
ncbi:myocardin-related transcription factor-related [Holotrichia oblita]|uniref:Myocardin-related transcription factor-related n=1 Tax=Holotrichia oblita TaxID=644536 RepID=A0ACB9TZI1_HOLOL|nr:myocardin-related transcription factor-related [Holotrichia oblita]